MLNLWCCFSFFDVLVWILTMHINGLYNTVPCTETAYFPIITKLTDTLTDWGEKKHELSMITAFLKIYICYY